MEYIDAKKMSYLLMNMDMKEKNIYINLFKYYTLINNKYRGKVREELDSYNYYNDLDKLEDKVYTINRNVLSDEERIILELNRIFRFLEININKIPSELAKYVFDELKELTGLISEEELKSPEMVIYFKKKISLLQAALGLRINFFNAASEVFKERVELLIAKDNINTLKKKDN